jgi:outer membrane usher protein FimD/PapC
MPSRIRNIPSNRIRRIHRRPHLAIRAANFRRLDDRLALHKKCGVHWQRGKEGNGPDRFFTPPLQAAYGLVQVDGPPHLPVTAGGIVAGTTDGRGDLVLPNLTPFVDNQITLGNLGNYPNYQVDTPEQTVVPQTDAGVATIFHVRPVLFVIGTVRIDRHGEMLIPRYGLLTLELPHGSKTSDLGTNAEFYFESVPAGQYRATVSLGDLHCGFTLTVPRSDAVQTAIGEQRCSLP